MARRSSSRPLYELMSKSAGRRAQVADDPEVQGEDGAAAASPLLAPGRTIRVPVGYLLVGLAAAILLTILAYMAGSWQAHASIREASDREYLDSGGGADLRARASDPLLGGGDTDPRGADRGSGREPAPSRASSPPPPDGGEPPPGADEDQDGTATMAAAGIPPALFRPRPEWGPVDADPRQEGRFYLVLAETRPEGALRLARFCREEGLEAYVVQGHNARLRQVIVLPGFPSSSTSDPDYLRLRQEVIRVGRGWNAMYPGESDLRDAYLSQ